MPHRIAAAVATVTALALSGCAGVGVMGGALTVAAVQAGTGAALKAGTEYRLNGSAHRTFALPLDEVTAAVRTVLQRMAMPVRADAPVEDRQEIVAEARDRVVEITLTPLTPATTALKLVVKQGFFLRDRATASEIIVQTEQALQATEYASPR